MARKFTPEQVEQLDTHVVEPLLEGFDALGQRIDRLDAKMEGKLETLTIEVRGGFAGVNATLLKQNELLEKVFAGIDRRLIEREDRMFPPSGA